MPSILLDYDRLFIESSIQVYCLTIVHIMLWLFELFVWIVLGSASILQSSSDGTLLLSFVESWSSHTLRTMLLISVRIVAQPRIRCWGCTSSESDESAAPLANVWKFSGTHSNEVSGEDSARRLRFAIRYIQICTAFKNAHMHVFRTKIRSHTYTYALPTSNAYVYVWSGICACMLTTYRLMCTKYSL